MKKLLISLLISLGCASAYADSKISAMPSSTTLNTGDIIPFVANPTGSATNMTITKSNLSTTMDILTQSSATATYLQKSSATATYQPIGSYLTGNQSITLSGDSSGTGATAITVTNAPLQPNITTFSSSITIPSPNGLKVVYGVAAGSMTASSATIAGQLTAGTYQGASLSTCGDATHALAWSGGSFSCQSITGTGGGGGSSSLQVTQSGVQITSPTASMNFFGNDFQLQATVSTSTIALNPTTTDFYSPLNTPASTTFTWTAGQVFSSITFLNQGNTRILFMNGNNLGTTSTFTWNGTTMSATNVSAGTVTATTNMVASGPLGLNVAYGAVVSSMTASSATVTGQLTVNSIKFGDGTVQVTSPTAGGGSGITALTGDVTASGSGSVVATAAALQNNITTFGSSITIPSPSGLNVKYGISAGSVTAPGITASTITVNNYIQTSFIAGQPDPITSSGTIYMKPDLRYGGNAYLADDPNPLLGDPAGTGVTILQTQCSSDKTAYCNSNFDLVFASSGIPIVNKSMYELGAEGYFDSTGTFVSSTTLPLGYHGYFWDYTNTATVWDATPNKHFQSYYDFYALGNVFVSSVTTFNGNINISSGVLLSNAAGTNGQVLTSQGAGTIPHWTTVTGGAGTKAPLTFVWDGGGVVISSAANSIARFTQVPYSITITSAVLSCGVASGFVVGASTFSVTVSSQTNTSFNGGSGYTSICASDCPSLSSQARKGDSALTGWTTSFSAGDYIWADINAVPQGADYCQLQLWVN